MQDKSFYKEISDGVKFFFNQQFKIDLSENLFTFLEIISWIAILFVVDFILRAIIIPIIKKIPIIQKMIGFIFYIIIVFLNQLFILFQ